MSPGCTKSLREGGIDILEVMGDWMSMVPKPLVAMKTEAAIALSHGGTLTLSVNPRPDGSMNEAEMRAFLELGAWIRERLPLFGPSSPIFDVGIFWTEASYRAWSLAVMERVELLSGDRSAQGLHRAMVGDHAQFDIVQAQTADFDAYRTVVLPESIVLDADTEDRVRAHVRAGGTLIVLGGDTPAGVDPSDGPAARLADVLGVCSRTISPTTPSTFASATPTSVATFPTSR